MERLITLSSIRNLNKLSSSSCEGVIFGSNFSTRFNYSLNEFEDINEYCLKNKLKRYVNVDVFINERELTRLKNYLEYIKDKEFDGIYFSDLAVLSIAKELNIEDLLIYDPDTLMTNTLDISFYLKRGLGVVLARELEIRELLEVVKNNPMKLDLQVFGHLKMASSKREFLNNYFNYIGVPLNLKNMKTIRLVEENRNYELPIVEDKYGTRIYTDYCFVMYHELAYIKDYLKRLIIDDNFIKDFDVVLEVAKDIKRLSADNSEYLFKMFKNNHPYLQLSSAYLYQKITKKKEENV